MKAILAISAGSLAMLLGGAAQAADIYGSIKDTGVSEAPAEIHWGGVYVGGGIGYGSANHELSLNEYFKDYCDTDGNAVKDPFKDNDKPLRDEDILKAGGTLDCTKTDGDFNPKIANTQIAGQSREIANLDGVSSTGLVGDVRLGFDAQLGNRIVAGVFGAYGFNNMETTASISNLATASIEKGDEWSLGARVGYLVNPRTLAYIMAAYTETDYDFSFTAGKSSGAKEVSFSGATIGGGIEFALTRNIFLGIEGTHTFYGSENIVDIYDVENNAGLRLDDELSETKVMGTMKIKLNGASFAN